MPHVCGMRGPLLALSLFITLVASARSDTLKVRSHDHLAVVTDPSKGFHRYPSTVTFPNGNKARRIIVAVTLGCPAGMRCADWDYLDRLHVHPIGSRDTIEVARLLTPYGGGFGKDWSWTWTADLTDLAPVFNGPAEVTYEHTGFEPNEDRGWSLTVEFQFIAGPPAAPVLAVVPLYDGNFRYGHRDRSIEADLVPRAVDLPAAAAAMELRVNHTGHGMQDDGCGEFCARTRFMKIEGDTIQARRIWKECGSNPVHPQAGTWIFDRANWCPGELHEAEHVQVPARLVKGGSRVLVDLDMEPYTLDTTRAVEAITAYAVVYGKPRALNDVAVDAVELPGARGEGVPGCRGARVRIRNRGSAPLRSLTLRYGTDALATRSLEWHGELPYNGTAEVELEGALGGGSGPHRFTVEALLPNGVKDGWSGDDRLSVPFRGPDVLPSTVVVQLRTNAEPGHNSLRVVDSEGVLVLVRPLGGLRPDTLYNDTLHLPADCYTLMLADTAGDGLEFWYNWKGGRGTLRLLDEKGHLLRSFDSDFGNLVYAPFRVEPGVVQVPDTVPAIGLFPTRTLGPTRLDYFANDTNDVVVQVLDEAKVLVEEHHYTGVKQSVFAFDLGYRPPQRYTVKVMVRGREVFSKRLRVVDDLD